MNIDVAARRVGISADDHVGLRVTDRARAPAFYGMPGLRNDQEHAGQTAFEIANEAGVYLNLSLNGRATPPADNVLMDCSEKWPGHTHAACIVDSVLEIQDPARLAGVPITQGPVDWGRRITCFLRDPDPNVLELDELRPRLGTVE